MLLRIPPKCWNSIVQHGGCLGIREQYVWCLMSQCQATMPSCCLRDGSKKRLHLPGAEGGAAPLLPLCFPSSCLSKVMEEGDATSLWVAASAWSHSAAHTFWGGSGLSAQRVTPHKPCWHIMQLLACSVFFSSLILTL